MCIFEITAILDQYKVQHKMENGQVMAQGKNSCWIDVTNWSRLQMAQWLKQ